MHKQDTLYSRPSAAGMYSRHGLNKEYPVHVFCQYYWAGEQIGAIAKPDDIGFTDSRPKTRSGKIIRHQLRTVTRGDEISSNTSTLENEHVDLLLQGKE